MFLIPSQKVLTLNQEGICACTYAIAVGDTCQAIADKKQISLAQLLSLNPGLDCNNLPIGRVSMATHPCVKSSP